MVKVHEWGKKTPLMWDLIELHKKEPELFDTWHELMIIMQQPSGFVDNVIMKWHLELQAKRYPCSLVQRDLFTGAYCEESRLTMSVMNQLTAWVMGKMSSVLQFTDTTAGQPF